MKILSRVIRLTDEKKQIVFEMESGFSSTFDIIKRIVTDFDHGVLKNGFYSLYLGPIREIELDEYEEDD